MSTPSQPYEYLPPYGGYYQRGYQGYPSPPGRRPRKVGIVGAVVSAVGAVIALVGMFLDWYSANGYDTDLRVIVKAAAAADSTQPAHAVFGWLLWVLLGLTIAVALLANVPGPLSVLLRILSPLFGLGCVFLTLGSISQLREGVSVLDHASVGLYAVLAGAVITGFGGVVGPRRG